MPRPHTKADTRRFQLLNQIGCIVCYLFHMKPGVPGDIHHIDGREKPGCHQKTLCLCPHHHRWPYPDSTGVSLCQGKKLFEQRYTTEVKLLERTEELLWTIENQFIGVPA